MKNLLTMLCFALLVISGCKPTEGPLSPPIIEPKLLACATTVTVKGFAPGATIDIYANGTTRIGGGVSDSPWGQVFSVSPALIAGNIITATQTIDGMVSKPSTGVPVESAREVFKGGKLPQPVLDKPIYNCGGAISVRNLAKGGYLKVYAGGLEIGHVDGCGDGQWLTVTPVFATGQSITADVKLCSQVSPLSDPVTVDPTPTTLPKPEIGDIYENGKFCVISNITNGARVKTYNGSTLIDDYYYPGGGQIVRLTPQVVPGDTITATQELCLVVSDPSDPSVVKPCSELPAPELGPICPGATTVKITKGVPGSRIRVYRDGVLAADGGGDELVLLAPAKHGENYWATQSLGGCVSTKSVAIAVDCERPTLMRPNIPYMGRAVAVAVDPADDNRITVASETGGLFRSTDKGTTWTQVSGATTFGYSDVTYLSFAPGVIVATAREDTRTISGGGIWRSTDYGVNWKKVPLTTPVANCINNITGYCLTVEADSKRVWAGTSCGLAYSNNAGLNWTFLPAVTGYNNDATFSVQTPGTKHIAIVTSAGVKVSTDGGSTFTLAMTGIPGTRWQGDHDQLAAAPNDPTHLFWAIYYIPTGDSVSWRGVFWSTDFGSNWKNAFGEKANRNRPLFVRTAYPLKGKANTYDVYWGSGSDKFRRATAETGTSGVISSFKDMAFDHADPSDVGFEKDSITPLLLLSDGGLHRTTDKGDNWKLTGGGPSGYNALQITEVTGQLHKSGGGADLYFATQDNDIWASNDLGVTWVDHRCCEGFFLNIMRDYYPPDETRLTGVSCGACGNFISKPLLASDGGFSNPAKDNGNPRLLKPGFYIQNTFPFDSLGSLFKLTKNTGSSWDSSYKFLQDTRDLSKLSGDIGDPVVFTAFKAAGVTPAGKEVVNIKRITGVLSAGGPVLSDVTGFGSLGIFPTMFAWYKPFGVDPNDPDFIIVADVVDGYMKVTTNGGTNWTTDTALTELMKGNGEFDFKWDVFSQFASIGFDPDCRDHILIGSQQSGIFTTFNRGATWGRVTGSEYIPYVSSFFFPGGNQVIISSYGRGLWSLNYTCDREKAKSQTKSYQGDEPFIWHGKARIALSSVRDPALMPHLRYFLMKGGDITGYTIDRETGAVKEVFISSGELTGYSWEGKATEVPFKVTTGKGNGSFGGDGQIPEMLREELRVKGLLLENNRFKAPVLAGKDILPAQLPKQGPPLAYITILNRVAGIAEVRGLEPVRVAGKNFSPKVNLEVYLDGERVKLNPVPQPDAKGSFELRIPQALDFGGHTVMVKQQAGKELLQDAATFVKRVRDDVR